MSAVTKPTVLPNPETIPSELRGPPQWVAWTYKPDGKKLPLDPKTGQTASSTDPSTWADFRTAYKFALRQRCGIGFVFSADDPFCGVDFDNCRSPETGAIKAEVWQMLEGLGSYSEVSPSGAGVKVICRAKLDKNHNKAEIELYDHSRFFTITGQVVPGLPTEINDAQAAVDKLIAEHFPNSNGHKPDPIPQTVVEGTRNDTLFRLACSLRERGLSQAAIEAALLAANTEHCQPPLEDDEVAAIAKSACRYEPGELNPPTLKPIGADDDGLQKDYGHAAVLAVLFKDRYRWAVHRGAWMHYQSGVWRPVPEEAVAKDAADALRRHYAAELAKATDKATVLDLTKKIAETCTYARITGALAFLKGWDGILTTPEQWDRDPWLLNVRNGTIDLRTCTLRPHDPSDLLTKMANVGYDPTATGEKWQQHVEKFLPDADIRRQVQRDLGGALPGAVLDECLPIWWGTGGNGKTTTLRTILHLLGDYGCRAAPDLLVQSKYERHPTEIADLCGKRLVFSVEMDKAKHLAEALVKDLTGGDVKKARYMRQDFFEFEQTFSIVLVCNQRPIVTGTDHGLWRRLRLIPWTYQVKPSERREQDEVIAELLTESAAILNWLLAGLRDRQQEPFWTADEVRAVTDAYRAEMDWLGDFLDECCILGPRYTVPKAELYAAYVEWCEQNHEKPATKKTFTRMLEDRGIGGKKGTAGVRLYCGVGLKVADSGSFSNSPIRNSNLPDYMENVPLSATCTVENAATPVEAEPDQGPLQGEALARGGEGEPVCHICGGYAFCAGDDGLVYCKDHAPDDQGWHPVPDT